VPWPFFILWKKKSLTKNIIFKEIRENAITISKMDSSNDNKLVHITGTALTDEILTPYKTLPIAENAIRLSSKVKMYQWEESENQTVTKKNMPTTKNEKIYIGKWSDVEINSNKFEKSSKYENPPKRALFIIVGY